VLRSAGAHVLCVGGHRFPRYPRRPFSGPSRAHAPGSSERPAHDDLPGLIEWLERQAQRGRPELTPEDVLMGAIVHRYRARPWPQRIKVRPSRRRRA
jgi:hypothetical protein